MTRILPILLVVGLVIAIYVWLRNASTVARISVEGGKVHVKRGELSSSKRRDIQEAVQLSRVGEATIRLYSTKNGTGVKVHPSDEGLEQRLRNAVGTWRLK